MATRVEVVERSEPTRCPLCLDALGPEDARAACEGCGTAHHSACRTELGGCGVLGCRFSVRSPSTGSGPLRERADRYVRTMAMAARVRADRGRPDRVDRAPYAVERLMAWFMNRVAGDSPEARLLVAGGLILGLFVGAFLLVGGVLVGVGALTLGR